MPYTPSMSFAGGPGGDPYMQTLASHPLTGAASNYQYPLTQGLMSGLTGAFGQQVPDYTQTALGLAGDPHAGPYAGVAAPSGVGVPGAQGTSTGSTLGGEASSLLASLATNPSLAKQMGSLISSLFSHSNSGVTAPNPTMTQMPFDVAAALPPALAAGAAPIASIPAGTVAVGAVGPTTYGATGAAASAAEAAGLSPVVPTASYMSAPAASTAADATGAASLGGSLLAGGLIAAPVIAGLMTPAVSEGASYWSNLANTLNGNSHSSPTFDQAQLQLALNGSGNPYTSAQLQAWGIPQLQSQLSNGFSIGGGGGLPNHNLQKF